jgi:hypothetical protein
MTIPPRFILFLALASALAISPLLAQVVRTHSAASDTSTDAPHEEDIRGYSSSSAIGVPNTAKIAYPAQANLSYTHDLAGYCPTFMINGTNLLRPETVYGGQRDVGYFFDTDRQLRFSVEVAF